MHYYVQLQILGGRLEAAFGLPPGPANNIFAIENYFYILMGRGWSLIWYSAVDIGHWFDVVHQPQRL